MKKTFLFAAMVAAALSTAQAQKMNYIPWTENALLMGGAISPNGQYVAGGDQAGRAFIYNTATGENKFFFDSDLEEGEGGKNGRVYSVNDDGVGVGYQAFHATKFNFSTGEYSYLFDEGEERKSSSRFISNDGTFECGFLYEGLTTRYPYATKDGKTQLLPEATEEWIGYETEGFAVTGASADGSVLMGLAVDNFGTFPLVVWVRNKDNATYSLVPVSKRFYDGTIELSGPQPYQMFQGTGISANGRWISVDVLPADYTAGARTMRYDVLNDVVEEIDCPDASGENWYVSTGISNDGTIVGYVENQQTNARTSMIIKGGESVAQYMADVYEDVPEIAKMELNGMNTPMGITPDGRYIIGFGYVDLDETTLCFGTYYFDTQGAGSGIKDVSKKNEGAQSNKVVASYSLDGKKLDASSASRKGLFFDKFADGRVIKRVVK